MILLRARSATAIRSGTWYRMTKSEREALVREVWNSPKAVGPFAKEVGVTIQAFSMFAKRMGLPARWIRLVRKKKATT